MTSPDWLEYLSHTADEGLRVTGPTRAAVFERAAWGMFSLLTDLAKVQEKTSVTIEISADDPLSLLIGWLNELNTRHQTEHLLLSRFRVDRLDDRTLTAAAWGEYSDPDRHELLTEIKAVTFCEAQLQQRSDHWVAQVIVDV